MADLESGLHYLLRVELAAHKTLEGEELKTFKDFVTVVAKVALKPKHNFFFALSSRTKIVFIRALKFTRLYLTWPI